MCYEYRRQILKQEIAYVERLLGMKEFFEDRQESDL